MFQETPQDDEKKQEQKPQDGIQDEVEKTADEIFKYLPPNQPSSRLLMIHFLYGPSTNPYVLRRTAVRAKNSQFENLAKKIALALKEKNNKEEIEDTINGLHAKALSQYIRHFNRENTFLHLVIKKFLENFEKYKEGLYGKLSMNESSPKGENFVWDEVHEDNSGYIEWNARKEAVGILVPPQKVLKTFFRCLYNDEWSSDNSMSRDKWKELFDLRKSHLYGLHLKQNKYKTDTSQTFIKELDSLASEWDLLSAYQSGMLYFIESLGNRKTKDRSCSIILHPTLEKIGQNPKEMLKLSVAIIAPSISTKKNESIKKINSQLSELNKKIGIKENVDYEDQLYRHLYTIVSKYHILQEDKRSLGTFEETLTDKIFDWSPFKKDIKLYGYWLLLLTQNLKGKIHEGKKLAFYFICGDKSEFLDSPNINFLPLPPEDLKPLKIPDEKIRPDNAEEIIKELLVKTSELLAKEHFPWFEGGRHALFWDIGSNGYRLPIGLVSIPNLTWKQLVSDLLVGKTTIGIPNSVLFSVCDEPEIAAVFSVSSNKNLRKEVLRLQDNKWRNWDNEKRIENLRGKLAEILETPAESTNIKEIVNVAIRLAMNPNKGGTIVFMESDSIKNRKSKSNKRDEFFGSMGAPWELSNMQEEDLIALIAHDGATVHFINNSKNQWTFRKLLTSDGIENEIIGELFKHVEANFEDNFGINSNNNLNADFCPLLFKGSRRWSAAIAAFHDEVKATLVISQDGEIYIWHVEDNVKEFDPEKVNVIEIDISGGSDVFNLKNGYQKKKSQK